MVVASFVIVSACGDKKDDVTGDKTGTTDLVKKDSITGQQVVQLKYVPKIGDKFHFRIIQKIKQKEKSPATEDKEIEVNNEIYYFYNKEVDRVEENGIINFRILFDSISISTTMGDQSVRYNSNINDSNKQKPEVIPYNSLINNPFYMRVNSHGKVTEVNGMEMIFESIYMAKGDSLDDSKKHQFKLSFSEQIRSLLQREYTEFPSSNFSIDSSWSKSGDNLMMIFETKEHIKHTLKAIEDRSGQILAIIDGSLQLEFKNKEFKEEGMTIKILDSQGAGNSKIELNLTRGCIQMKESNIDVRIDMKLSAQGQSANSSQSYSETFSVTLLN
jgi:hypothetical protein